MMLVSLHLYSVQCLNLMQKMHCCQHCCDVTMNGFYVLYLMVWQYFDYVLMMTQFEKKMIRHSMNLMFFEVFVVDELSLDDSWTKPVMIKQIEIQIPSKAFKFSVDNNNSFLCIRYDRQIVQCLENEVHSMAGNSIKYSRLTWTRDSGNSIFDATFSRMKISGYCVLPNKSSNISNWPRVNVVRSLLCLRTLTPEMKMKHIFN